MASSSSGSNAYDNRPFDASTPDGFDLSAFERGDDDGPPNFPDLRSLGAPGSSSFEDIFNPSRGVGGDVGFERGVPAEHLVGMQSLGPFALDFDLGLQELGLGPSSMASHPNLDMFMRQEGTGVGSALGSSGVLLDLNAPFSSIGAGPSQSSSADQATLNTIGAIAGQSGVIPSPPSFPSRLHVDLDLSIHSSFEGNNPEPGSRDVHSRSRSRHTDAAEAAGTTFSDPPTDQRRRSTRIRIASKSPQRRPSPVSSDAMPTGQDHSRQVAPQRRRGRFRNARVSKAKNKGKEKETRGEKEAKEKAQKDVWHVITVPTPEAGPSGSTPATRAASQPGPVTPSTSPNDAPTLDAASNSGNTAAPSKRAGLRKQIFQSVNPAKTVTKVKPEWHVSPPPSEYNPEDYKLKPRKNPLKPGTHSDLGWVLARVRESATSPHRYSWYAAQIHVGSLLVSLKYGVSDFWNIIPVPAR